MCRSAGAASALPLAADITDRAAVDGAVRTVLDRFGHVDVVVHSAGVTAFRAFLAVPAEAFDRVLAVNVSGAANVTWAVLPPMRERNAGTVVVVGSLEGHITPPYMAAYAASKWAARSLTRAWQMRTGTGPVCTSAGSPRRGRYADLPAVRQLPMPRGPATAAGEQRGERRRRRTRAGGPTPPLRRVGLGNLIAEFGYLFTPAVYDALVTPMFRTVIMKRRSSVPPHPGNLFEPPPDEVHRIRG